MWHAFARMAHVTRMRNHISKTFNMSTKQIYDHVTERYSAASRGTALEYGASVAKAFGYSEEELADIPKESNLGLSCGNPMAMASIREVCRPHMTIHPARACG